MHFPGIERDHGYESLHEDFRYRQQRGSKEFKSDDFSMIKSMTEGMSSSSCAIWLSKPLTCESWEVVVALLGQVRGCTWQQPNCSKLKASWGPLQNTWGMQHARQAASEVGLTRRRRARALSQFATAEMTTGLGFTELPLCIPSPTTWFSLLPVAKTSASSSIQVLKRSKPFCFNLSQASFI